MTEFHVAIGQYTNYRYALEDLQYEHILYLAVPVTIYNDFFKRISLNNPQNYVGTDSVSLKVVVKKANIILENNHLIIDLNMRIVAPSPSEAAITEDKNTHNG
jgi:hypothetical protein